MKLIKCPCCNSSLKVRKKMRASSAIKGEKWYVRKAYDYFCKKCDCELDYYYKGNFSFLNRGLNRIFLIALYSAFLLFAILFGPHQGVSLIFFLIGVTVIIFYSYIRKTKRIYIESPQNLNSTIDQ